MGRRLQELVSARSTLYRKTMPGSGSRPLSNNSQEYPTTQQLNHCRFYPLMGKMGKTEPGISGSYCRKNTGQLLTGLPDVALNTPLTSLGKNYGPSAVSLYTQLSFVGNNTLHGIHSELGSQSNNLLKNGAAWNLSEPLLFFF